ncbi:MFS transporter [Marinifilum sp. D714]|uniref:MFS transporter n=1 Tax=Marinifilum sp. D714 TaxID=2937523 RepID=UPI0027C5A6E0|nr:MFS transporter [Marinifilum sp. D714]MDQ2178045.1 MFS transporter [Marinifilum sp. D714]
MDVRTRLNAEQKNGIFFLLLSKAFERIAFYMVMAILMQYLTNGIGVEAKTAGIQYSLFYGMFVVGSLFSGWIGDVCDRIKFVKLGFLMMIVMYLLFVFIPNVNWLVVMVLLIMGFGHAIITPNQIVFLGNIYNEQGKEIKALPGFIWYSIIVSVAAMLAAFLANVLKNQLGYLAVFIAAFVFAGLALMCFLMFKKAYRKLDLVAEQKEDQTEVSIRRINKLILVAMISIGVLIRFVLNQKNLSFTFAMRDYLPNSIDLSWFTDGLLPYLSIMFLLIFLFVVSRLKRMNWKVIFNFILLGIAICVLACTLVLGYEPLSNIISGNVVFLNVMIMIVLSDSLLSSVMFYSVYRSSPLKHKGLFQGFSFLIVGLSSYIIILGVKMYENIGATVSFLILMGIMLASGVLMFGVKKSIGKE